MKETIYFGTYTRRISEGIYTAELDTDTGLLSNLELKIKEHSPTYLAIDKNKNIYSVGSEDGQGGIVAYNSDNELLNYVVKDGAPLCFVAIDEDRDFVYGANYHNGQVMVYKRDKEGKLHLSDWVQHTGFGPHENQEVPHVHYTDLTPDKYLLTCDLGTDKLTSYDLIDGKLKEIKTYNAAPGSGPRHIVFKNTDKIAYLICELNSTIEVLIYDGLGEFHKLQTISTLPDDADKDEFNATAAIRITSDDRFVYASNRGHNSIVVYESLADGSLKKIQTISSFGDIPRDINLSKDEKVLIVANQDTDNVTTFLRDKETGLLTKVQDDFFVPEAVCVYPA